MSYLLKLSWMFSNISVSVSETLIQGCAPESSLKSMLHLKSGNKCWKVKDVGRLRMEGQVKSASESEFKL